jgi:hypothetical protein
MIGISSMYAYQSYNPKHVCDKNKNTQKINFQILLN